MTTISVCNLKGGVSKTVTCIHLGAALARRGKKVLLIDTDLQHGLTSYFDLDVRGRITTAEILLDNQPLEAALIEVRPRLWVVPASSRMEIADKELPHLSGGDLRLRVALKAAPHFDYILLDCPSGWGATVRNAMLAATHLLMPINSEPAALSNAAHSEAKAREISSFFAHDLVTLGALLTCWRHTKVAGVVAAGTQRRWPEATFSARIRRTEKINELHALRETIYDRDDASILPVREDYEALTQEVISRCERAARKAKPWARKTAAVSTA